MKFTIRNKVWETNSSSVHSIVISDKGLRKSKLKPCKDGYIHIALQYFGKELCVYWEQKDKLSYLLTCAAYMAGCIYGSNDYEHFYGSYYFKNIEEAILNYINDPAVLGIKIYDLEKAEIDHQSAPEYGEFPIDVNIWNEKSIQNFVFNSYVALKTDCD